MSSAKEIRTKISSVKSTQKITSAMELVAASKMRRAQERMAASKPYATKIYDVISHLAHATTDFEHPYMSARPTVKSVGYILVSSDRGLCGGLNVNVFKQAIADMKEWSSKGVDIKLGLVGSKAISFFKSSGGQVLSVAQGLGDKPTVDQLIGSVKVMLDAFDQEKIDRVFLVNNSFVNTMTQKPVVTQLLPLKKTESKGFDHNWDYLYEPAPESLLDSLLTRYIESQVYQAVVENIACEQAARMVAMKAATDNAGDLIDELQLVFNKARQAAITQELAEICSGAAAV